MTLPSAHDIRDFKALEAISQAPFTISGGGGFLDPYDVIEHLFPDRTSAKDWVNDKIGRDYLVKMHKMLRVRLSEKGRAALSEASAKRDDTVAFKREMRYRLLKWSYERSHGGYSKQRVTVSDDAFWFYGREVSLSDLAEAAEYLAKHGLLDYFPKRALSGNVHLLTVALTVDGEECVLDKGGDIVAYLETKRKLAQRYGNTFNIGAINGGVLSLGDDNEISLSALGDVSFEVIKLGEALRQAIPVLGLDQAQNELARKHILHLELAEVPSKVHLALLWTQSLDAVESGALGHVLALAATHAFHTASI